MTDLLTYDDILSAMKSRYRELAGFDADNASDIGIRLKVLASEVAEVYNRIGELRGEVFPQTSTGKYLELHAEGRAITRKPAIPAEGTLVFSRETPAYSDITIPAGIICSTTEPQILFETTCDGVIKAGETQTEIPAVASSESGGYVNPGASGNVAAHAVCLMISPAAGITSVTNPQPFGGGVDEESDDALRDRLLAAYQNISNGTNCAFYYDLAMSHEGVSSANILPRRRGRGTVDVIIDCRSQELQNEIVAAIQSNLNHRKEINVDVLVTAAVRDYPSLNVEIAVKQGYSFDLVAERAKAQIAQCIEELGVGDTLILAAVCSRLLTVDGVYNCRIVVPSKDIIPASDHVLCPGSVDLSGMAVG